MGNTFIMKNRSIWYDGTYKSYPPLKQNIEVDTVIIGGGIAGLACAYELSIRGQKVAILEASVLGSGETGKSSAMISFAHDLVYARLIKKHGVKIAGKYLENAKVAMAEIEEIIKSNNIECEYEKSDLILFATKSVGVKKMQKEEQAYRKLGETVEFVTDTELPYDVLSALKIPNQARFNPIKFLHGLADIVTSNGGQIFEHTHVVKQPKNNILEVEDITVKAKNFIIATHFPFINFPGWYFIKMYQDRRHNIVFDGKIKFKNMYESIEMDGFEYRMTNQGVLCGGANVRTGQYKYESQFDIIEKHLQQKFSISEEKIVSRFGAQDCMTFDLLPFAGTYSKKLKNVYISSGFNKWGFTNAFVSAQFIADEIENKPVDNIFSPRRAYFRTAPLKFLANAGEIVGSFANRIFNLDAKKFKNIQRNQGAIIRHRGKRIGVYKDGEGNIKAIHAVCPHLGCNLKWNKDETTWDCPCHGSRFDVDGRIINNPTLKKAEKTKKGA